MNSICNEYYPFGLQTATSWTRENNTSNNFLYNGGTELNTTTQVYDLHYRNYDPVLGRMNQVDPVASKYGSVTPYNYAFNAPTNMNDPLGDDPGSSASCSWCNPKPRPTDTGSGGGGGGGNPYASLMGRSAGFFEPGWQPGSGSLSAGAFASMDARYNAGAIARGDFRGLSDGTYTNDGNGGFTYAPIAYTYWLSSSLTMAYTQVGREVMGTLRNVVVNGIRDIPVVVNGNPTEGDLSSNLDILGALGRFLGSTDFASGAMDLSLGKWADARAANILNGKGKLHPSFMNLADKNFLYANRFLSGTRTLQVLKAAKVAGPVASLAGIGISAHNLASGKGTALDVADIGVNAVGLGTTVLVTLGLVSNPVGWVIGAGVLIYNGVRLYQSFTEGN